MFRIYCEWELVFAQRWREDLAATGLTAAKLLQPGCNWQPGCQVNSLTLERIQFGPRRPCITPSRERCQVKPRGHKKLFKFQRIKCTTCLTLPETKVTTPAGKGHACHLSLFMTCCPQKLQRVKWRFLTIRSGFSQVGVQVQKVHKGRRDPRDFAKWWRTERPTVSLYLEELPNWKCHFRNQVRQDSPTMGLPPLALWLRIGATIGITLDKNGSVKWSVRNWILSRANLTGKQ